MQRLNVRDVALGKWPGILVALGMADADLTGKHGPCPFCGGKDRFRFDDKDGRGTWFCSQCGAGDGISLVMKFKDCDFKTAAQEVEQVAGIARPGRVAPVQDESKKIDRLRQVWAESSPLQHGDEAMRYLAGRGLTIDTPPSCLRLHPGLDYWHDKKLVGRYPTLVARVVAADGSGATLHRTYLQDGKKAPVPEARKLMSGKPIAGGAIRLASPGEWLGIAEGIETALAATELFKVPVWSCINAAGIESFEPPAGVETLTIFADNDANYAGHKAAYTAAHKLAIRGFDAEVSLPPIYGDWLDFLNQERGGK